MRIAVLLTASPATRIRNSHRFANRTDSPRTASATDTDTAADIDTVDRCVATVADAVWPCDSYVAVGRARVFLFAYISAVGIPECLMG